MWEEDTSVPFDSGRFDAEQEHPPQESAAAPPGQLFPGMFPALPFQGVMLPNVVSMTNLYDAARARAVADQQLSKLFNPEYYI